jgi:hypothetical protein
MNHSSPVRNQSRDMAHDQSCASANARLALSPKNGIPMPDYHIKRTESELQLREDMAMAEYRDRCMFNRLVTGIQQRKQHYNSQQHQYYYGHGHGEGFADGTATTETATETGGRNMHTSTRRSRTNARTSLPRSLLVPPPQNLPKQDQDQETNRTIASIPYTRSCPSSSHMKDQAKATSSMITPIASDGEEYYTSRRREAPTYAGDWSIEGFDDEPPSPLYSSRVNIIPHGWAPDFLAQSVNSRNSYDQTDQLFDMDL